MDERARKNWVDRAFELIHILLPIIIIYFFANVCMQKYINQTSLNKLILTSGYQATEKQWEYCRELRGHVVTDFMDMRNDLSAAGSAYQLYSRNRNNSQIAKDVSIKLDEFAREYKISGKNFSHSLVEELNCYSKLNSRFKFWGILLEHPEIYNNYMRNEYIKVDISQYIGIMNISKENLYVRDTPYKPLFVKETAFMNQFIKKYMELSLSLSKGYTELESRYLKMTLARLHENPWKMFF